MARCTASVATSRPVDGSSETGMALPSPDADAALDGGTAHADRDHLLLAAHAALRPRHVAADMGDGLEHVERHAGDGRVAKGAADLAVDDLVAAPDTEHELARRV